MRARPPRCSSTCPARFARPPTSSKPSECSSAGISRTRTRDFEALGIFRVAEGAPAPEAAGARIAAMAWGGYALWLAGKPDQAVTLARRGYEAADALKDSWERAALLSDWATLHAWRREPAKAKELAHRALDLAGQGRSACGHGAQTS